MPDPTLATVSASQAGALFNVHPYMTRWMLAQAFLGNPLPRADDNRMQWGRLMEPLLIKTASEDLHLEVRPNLQNAYIRRGPLGCTRDADIIAPDLGPGALEVKCVFDYRSLMEHWDGGKTPPKHVEIQLQTQMYVGDGHAPYQWGVIAMWCAGEMHYFKREPIIPDFWRELEQHAQAFLDDIAAGIAGEPIGTIEELPLLQRLFAPKPGVTLDLRDHPQAEKFTQDVRMLDWHTRERKGHEKGERALKAKLTAIVGEADDVQLLDGVRLRLKKIDRGSYSVAASSYVTMTPFVPAQTADQTSDDNPLAGG